MPNFPHMFLIPALDESYDDEVLENSIWMFIKKNFKHRPGISIEHGEVPAKRATTAHATEKPEPKKQKNE